MDLITLKAELKKQTDKAPEKFYPVKTLKAGGFHREHCTKCGKYYWTTTSDKVCGEPNCAGGYAFIGEKKTKKQLSFTDVWKDFSAMFRKQGYTPIKRYPVVARWRDDSYWTNASIYAFQPYVVNGEVEPPANPLIIPQACVRFNDIDNVGITGRHYTSFVMIGQHAFYPKKDFEQEKYFADILAWLEKGVGLKKDDIKFHEDQWGGGGNLGVSMEFFAHGLELGNQVYMTYEITESGGLKDLKKNVLDMGMGQERYSWLTNGTNTSYEANFPTVVKMLYEQSGVKPNHELVRKFLPYSGLLNFEEADNLEKIWESIAKKISYGKNELKEEILKLGAVYSIGDHARTLLFAINDGALPSNIGGQYNLRVLYRRVIDFILKYGWQIDLEGIIEEHARYLKPQYPELTENLDELYKILRIERGKYNSTLEKSRKIVQQLIERKEAISEKKFLELYDSAGITPELIEEEAKKLGAKIKVPENFYAMAAALHPEVQKGKEIVSKEIDVSKLCETEQLYYKDTKLFSFKAKILKIIGKHVILDKTAFYPTGGGQEHDTGTLENAKVINATKVKGVVLHEIDNATGLKEGQTIEGKIDSQRRISLAKNHDAAHIIGGASRKVLGKHIWQAGSQIDADKGRLDITHYQNLTDVEKYEIEKLANKIISEKRKITKKVMQRNEAEEKFGFILYQGGAVPGKEIRVVGIENFDTQACGGTHLDNTSEVEGIRIVKTEKIQDGVIRLVFVAGKQLLEQKEFNEKEFIKNALISLEKFGVKIEKAGIGELGAASQVFKVKAADVPKTFERFFSEIKDNSERIDDLNKILKLKPEKGEEQFTQDLKKTKEISVIARLVFEHWKSQGKQINELEERLAIKRAEEMLNKLLAVGSLRFAVCKMDSFGLALKVANYIIQKGKSAVAIISADGKTVCTTETKADCLKILSALMPGARVNGNNKRAIALGELALNEKEIIEKIKDAVK